MVDDVLIEIDERGRTSLGKLHADSGRYIGERLDDGTVVLHPATVMTTAQARLLTNDEANDAIAKLAADPTSAVRRGRPRRKNLK